MEFKEDKCMMLYLGKLYQGRSCTVNVQVLQSKRLRCTGTLFPENTPRVLDTVLVVQL